MIQFFEVTDLKKENPSDAEESGEKKNLLNTFMDTISGIFAPVLGVMSGAGMLKALLILCTTFGWLKADMGTYRICMRQQMESLRLSRYFWHILQQKKIQSE